MASNRARARRLLIGAVLSIATLTAAQAETRQGYVNVLRAGPSAGVTFVAPDPLPPGVSARRAANITVTYVAPFPADAKTAFQRAVNILKPLLNSNVTITVRATYITLPSGVLGSAGPSFMHRNFTGAPRANTWYVDAIANKHRGIQLNTAPDINASFSSAFPNWHFEAGNAPAGKFDFTSVVLHELTHGIGFLGLGTVDAVTGKGRVKSGVPANPSIYDVFTESGAGTPLRNFPDNSVELGDALKSDNLFYDSTRVRNAFGNLRARIFAPPAFHPGSSYSHLNETSFPAGNANSLMTPFIGPGETIRKLGPVTRAILADEGW